MSTPLLRKPSFLFSFSLFFLSSLQVEAMLQNRGKAEKKPNTGFRSHFESNATDNEESELIQRGENTQETSGENSLLENILMRDSSQTAFTLEELPIKENSDKRTLLYDIGFLNQKIEEAQKVRTILTQLTEEELVQLYLNWSISNKNRIKFFSEIIGSNEKEEVEQKLGELIEESHETLLEIQKRLSALSPSKKAAKANGASQTQDWNSLAPARLTPSELPSAVHPASTPTHVCYQGFMSPYCPDQNSSLTQHPSAFPTFAVERDEISRLTSPTVSFFWTPQQELEDLLIRTSREIQGAQKAIPEIKQHLVNATALLETAKLYLFSNGYPDAIAGVGTAQKLLAFVKNNLFELCMKRQRILDIAVQKITIQEQNEESNKEEQQLKEEAKMDQPNNQLLLSTELKFKKKKKKKNKDSNDSDQKIIPSKKNFLVTNEEVEKQMRAEHQDYLLENDDQERYLREALELGRQWIHDPNRSINLDPETIKSINAGTFKFHPDFAINFSVDSAESHLIKDISNELNQRYNEEIIANAIKKKIDDLRANPALEKKYAIELQVKANHVWQDLMTTNPKEYQKKAYAYTQSQRGGRVINLSHFDFLIHEEDKQKNNESLLKYKEHVRKTVNKAHNTDLIDKAIEEKLSNLNAQELIESEEREKKTSKKQGAQK